MSFGRKSLSGEPLKKRFNMDSSISIRDEFIKLGQAMKLAGLVGSGVEAKILIEEGQVSVNGEKETRRGRKLYKGDSFSYKGNKVTVE